MTAEIRWFFDARPHLQSLVRSLPFAKPSRRTDYYLMDSGERLGIKWREGAIEIKQQRSKVRNYQHPFLSGELEFWKKWSFNLENREDYPDQCTAQHWLPVEKSRRLARLAYDHENQTATPLSSGKESENACEVEITQIQITERTYYTLGLEASGISSCLRENLIAAIDYLLKSGNLDGLDLPAKRSNNYARWIQTTFSNQLPND